MSYWDEKHSEDKEKFQRECMDVGHHVTTKGSHFFMCCVDGSNQSELAFQSAMNLRRKFDHINVFHAYKDIPDLQPPSWRHTALESKYEVELIGAIPKRLYSMTWVDRLGKSVNDVLHSTVDPEHFQQDCEEPSPMPGRPDFIVMGHHGRKGPKERKAAIGSTADEALRNLHYPCIIVKNVVPAGPRSYLMAVDDSNASRRGFDILMRLVNPRDKVTLVHFTHPLQFDPQMAAQKERVKHFFEKDLQEIGPPDSSFAFVEYPKGGDLVEVIIDYVNDSSADLFAIAPRATRDRSSITEAIVNSVLITVVLCKN